MIKQQDNNNYSVIDNIYLYAMDLNEAKNQYPIKKCENSGLKWLEDPKTFIEY